MPRLLPQAISIGQERLLMWYNKTYVYLWLQIHYNVTFMMFHLLMISLRRLGSTSWRPTMTSLISFKSLKLWQNQIGKKIKVLRLDNGGEYMPSSLTLFARSKDLLMFWAALWTIFPAMRVLASSGEWWIQPCVYPNHEYIDQGEDDIDQGEDGVLGSWTRRGPYTWTKARIVYLTRSRRGPCTWSLRTLTKARMVYLAGPRQIPCTWIRIPRRE